MTTDVVVVTRQSRNRLERCLEHLRRQTCAFHLIVIDNASSDGTPCLVQRRFPEATLIVNSDNVGFARAANHGARAGRGEAIVLVNDDLFVEPDFVAAITAPMRRQSRIGMVAGMSLLSGAGDRVDGFGIELDVTLAAYNRLRFQKPSESPGVLAGPSGGAAAYRRTAWDAARGFEEAFFAYGEDVDLALRLRRLGWHATDASSARGVHLGGASFGVNSPLQRRVAGFARGFLLRRYGVLRSRWAVRALLVEALVVGWAAIRFRTISPLKDRIVGWQAAGRGSLKVPADAIDRSITLGESIHRLLTAYRLGDRSRQHMSGSPATMESKG